MVNKNAVIYIYTKNGLHNYGFVLEIIDSVCKQKLYKNMVDEFINQMGSDEFKEAFGLFWQSGCHDRYGGYNYFEIWDRLPDWKQDIILNFVLEFSRKWNILSDVGRPKDFPV